MVVLPDSHQDQDHQDPGYYTPIQSSKFKVQSSKYFICHCHKDNETVEATRLTQLNNNK